VELCALYNQTGRHWKALHLLCSRKFQPWEGGEGQALGQHVRTRLALGREAMAHGDLPCAMNHFEDALTSPENLGEAKHLLANQSDIHYWLGIALDLLGKKKSARKHWLAAATFKGDFKEMGARAFSEMTYYSALAWERLGQKTKAKKLLRDLLAYAEKLETTPAKIDYFATSLPTMLLFEDDIQFRQETTALFLQAQANLGLNNKTKSSLSFVLQRGPNHALAEVFNHMKLPATVNHVAGQRKVNALKSHPRLFRSAMPAGETLLPFREPKNDSSGHPTNSFPRCLSLPAKLNLKPGLTPAVFGTNCRNRGKHTKKSNENRLTDYEPK
jgi:tetratricopeptide (TPR) repeat protein